MTLELHPGVTFAQYTLERRLGGGGFGDVWLAHGAPGTRVALKVLRGQYQGSEAARLRAEIELAAAASSGSSHIVRVLDGGSEPAPFVVMEYIEGVDLGREIATRGTLPIAEVLHIASGIADALGTLQLAGIIHSDVKPANVMIDTKGVVKLTDFGMAEILGIDSATATSQMPMSMAYAAPEVWEGKASYLSDHYAFAVLLYQCLTGRPPFAGTYPEIYRHHLQSEPDLSALPPETPPSLRILIGACLAKDPEQRPPNAPAIQAALTDAETELSAGMNDTAIVRRTLEPKQLGPWIIDHRSLDRDWTFICHHESTYEEAVVELHFGNDLADGYPLRKAVDVNRKLLPLGAERLIDTSRFVLRPGESWKDAPEGDFVFWVARAVPARTTLPEVSPDALHSAAESLNAIIKLAAEEGINLALRPENVWFSPSGRVHVERPGLPPYDNTDPYAAADAWLTSELAKLSSSRAVSLAANVAPGQAPQTPPSQSSTVQPQQATPLPGVQRNAWEPEQQANIAQAQGPFEAQQPDVQAMPRRRASFSRRAGAYLIDWVVVAGLRFLTFVFLGAVAAIFGLSRSYGVTPWLVWPITLAAFPVYQFAFTAGPTRRTIGMLTLGTWIVSEAGDEPISPSQAFIRTLVLYVGSLFVLGCLWMLWDPSHKTLWDKASKSRVIH